MPDRRDLKKEGSLPAQSLRVPSITTAGQAPVAAGHAASTVRKHREMKEGIQLTFSHVMMPLTLGVGLPSSVKSFWKNP